ncbi:tetratricopeptide repeat protein [Macellibacteroides fermentans]|uniref:tetratricopeptide repeat protein n=1 Tax=Macellibacteroides fermentans TaxID=879969 RepID=UPI00406D1E1D
MDQLEIILARDSNRNGKHQSKSTINSPKGERVNFIINGVPLFKMVHEERMKGLLERPGDFSQYIGGDPKDLLSPYSDELLKVGQKKSSIADTHGRITIGRYEDTGYEATGDITLELAVEGDTVFWNQILFENDWEGSGLVGSYAFDRTEYEEALKIERVEYWTGWAYDEGTFFEKDSVMAMEYFRRSAEKGHVPAHYYMGWYYQEGFAGRKNYKKAIAHYEIAASMGDPWSMANLGRMNAVGMGVKRDYAVAVYWYEKAALLGDPLSMANLAWCFEQGKGVEKDLEEARRWYKRAGDLGEIHAREWLTNNPG